VLSPNAYRFRPHRPGRRSEGSILGKQRSETRFPSLGQRVLPRRTSHRCAPVFGPDQCSRADDADHRPAPRARRDASIAARSLRRTRRRMPAARASGNRARSRERWHAYTRIAWQTSDSVRRYRRLNAVVVRESRSNEPTSGRCSFAARSSARSATCPHEAIWMSSIRWRCKRAISSFTRSSEEKPG